MSDIPYSQKWQDEQALFRFQTISPLLDTELDAKKKNTLRQQIAQDKDISIRTLYRWEKLHAVGGFSALKPANRAQRRSAKLPKNFSEVLQQAILLKREVPLRSVEQIIYILEGEGWVGHGELKRSTLQRYLYNAGYLSDSKLTPSWLYKGMLRQLGLEPKFYRSEAKDQLQNEIRRIRTNDKKKIVCVLDEAHLLDKETLEEFRFLLNFEFDSTSPMALILVGQTELWVEKLRLQRYAAIRQRIDVNCVIPHLDRAETERYVRSHLEYAEGSTEIFTMKALDVIAKESAGIPRVINRICEKSLMYAFQLQRKLVDDYMVNFVLEHEIAH